MRVHRLRARAFGPFAGEVELDVDALAASGLFLVHGPTGAGKTSLLDAVCFALYGDVPGARSAKSLRSDHAAPDVVPSVELEFSCGRRRFRIRRSPAHSRPKRRGDGVRAFPATVELGEWRCGELVPVTTRIDEAAALLDDVLGMGKEQFAKVVLLPQGDFAAFLRASPEERRALLERLFDIERYADVERWLVEARRRAGAGALEVRAALEVDLARVREVVAASGVTEAEPPGSGTTEPGPLGSGGTEPEPLGSGVTEPEPLASEVTPPGAGSPELVPQVQALVEAVQRRVAGTMARFDAASTAEHKAAADLAAGRLRGAAAERGEHAREVLAELGERAEELAGRRRRLTAARSAAEVSGHLQARDRAEAEVQDARTRLEGARRAAAVLGLDHGDGEQQPALALTAAIGQHDETVAELLRLAAAAEQRSVVVATRETDAARLQSELGLRTAERSAAERTVAAARAEVEAVTAVGIGLDALVAERSLAHDRLAVGRSVLEDQPRLLLLREEAADVREQAQAARGRELDLRARRLDGMAAELAAGLVPGDPCPVCGAAEHPAPARTEQSVSAADVAAAAAAASRLVEAAGTLDLRVAALTRSVADRVQALGGAVDGPGLEAALTGAEAALQSARTRLAEERASHESLEVATERLAAASAKRDRAASALVAVRARRDEAAGQERRDVAASLALASCHAEQCPCGTGRPAARTASAPDAEAVAATGRAHVRAARAAQALAEAQEAHTDASRRWADAEAALTAALDTDFGDAGAARAAALPGPEVDRLAEDVHAADRRRATAEATLCEPDVAVALGSTRVDVTALQAAAAEARTTLLRAKDDSGAAERAARALAPLAAAVLDRAATLGPALDLHLRLKTLADAVSGTGTDNALRMRLTSFVLAARLEKVVALANERLRLMGAGRYVLEHSDERAAGGARGGLGLRVLDQWTGRTRETSSLSGGESFMASLALALGLADAVREEAGGADIGTLFVDEGFGSLDEDSLEQVLGVLDSLREGGRAVGVVSHVPELRGRIPSQVVVRKTTTGSTISTTVAGAGAGAAAAPATAAATDGRAGAA
ncbi:MAG TPA: AAA family ATPase [Dermatophilaceae bacterium]|nr:AAA family ATPase [Dermatophilaceae bacterium]